MWRPFTWFHPSLWPNVCLETVFNCRNWKPPILWRWSNLAAWFNCELGYSVISLYGSRINPFQCVRLLTSSFLNVSVHLCFPYRVVHPSHIISSVWAPKLPVAFFQEANFAAKYLLLQEEWASRKHVRIFSHGEILLYHLVNSTVDREKYHTDKGGSCFFSQFWELIYQQAGYCREGSLPWFFVVYSQIQCLH